MIKGNTLGAWSISFSELLLSIHQVAVWVWRDCALLRIERSGFEAWPGALRCVLGQDTTLRVPLSTQVNKWIPANLMLRIILHWISIPSRREWKYFYSLHATRHKSRPDLMGHLARTCRLKLYWHIARFTPSCFCACPGLLSSREFLKLNPTKNLQQGMTARDSE